LNKSANNPLKRIIYAWNYVEWGGSQIYTLALIREARKTLDVLVVLPQGSSEEFLSLLDGENISYELYGPSTDLGEAPSIRRKGERHWRKRKSENALVRHLLAKDLSGTAVHVDLTPHQSYRALSRLAARTHVYFTMHNAMPQFSGWRESIWRSKIGRLLRTGRFHIFAANENAKAYFRRFVTPQQLAAIVVTRAGIDPATIDEALSAAFDRSRMLERFGLSHEKTTVLTVGQFIDRKGRWPLLEAIKEISRRRDDIQFVWLMPKLPVGAELARVREFELGDAFKMVLSADAGATRTEILAFFRIADVYLLPSFVEGVPISLLEAMAIGLPSISTNINGIPEAIENDVTGILIEPGNVRQIVDAVIRLAENPAEQSKFSSSGRDHVIDIFDETHAAEIAVARYKADWERELLHDA
jgi:glycosyltransferase involved in cell wall biosynthesis